MIKIELKHEEIETIKLLQKEYGFTLEEMIQTLIRLGLKHWEEYEKRNN